MTSFDCLTCGACCVAMVPEQESYAETTWTDERKLGRAFVHLNVVRPTRAGMTDRGMRVPHGAIKTVQRGGEAVCVALEGEIGCEVSCSVYSRRPRVCKSSCVPGDDVCREDRRRLGDLDVKRLDRLFDEHMQEAFGDRRQEFTVMLTEHLRKLWLSGVKTRTGDDMTVADEEAFLTGVYGRTYPATGPEAPQGWSAPADRDQARPPCGGCGGAGVGDYPYACTLCGGSGNG